jgi:hypothetical protein
MWEALEGIFRSPESILMSNGQHEVRFAPLRFFALAAALLDSLFLSILRLL